MEMSQIDQEITSTSVPDPDYIPEICGFNLLIRPIPVKEKTKGGIYLPDKAKEDLKYLTNVGRVVAMGPYAYKSEKFDQGDWCSGGAIEVGDFVVYGRHDGEKMKIGGVVFTLLKDISVRMRVEDPGCLDTSINLGD